MGLPFGPQIDMWSVGLVLLELWTGQPFFVVHTRDELYMSLCQKLSPPPRLRFACGKYTEQLEKNCTKSKAVKPLNFSLPDHIKTIKRILSKPPSGDPPPDFVHFISLLLHPDPNERLSANDALQHEFLTGEINIPVSLVETSRSQSRVNSSSIANLRRSQSISLQKHHAATVTRPSPVPPTKPLPMASPSRAQANAIFQYQVPVSYAAVAVQKVKANADHPQRLLNQNQDHSEDEELESEEELPSISESKDSKEYEVAQRSPEKRSWYLNEQGDLFDTVVLSNRKRRVINYSEDEVL